MSVDLSSNDSETSLQRYCFTDKSYNVEEAIKLSFSMLDLADHSITIPFLSITYLAPIYSILMKMNILSDFVLYVQGKTGTRKSSTTAAFMSHYGDFNRDTFSSSFRDTLNNIEQKAYVLKDTINVIDDFKPETNMQKELSILEGVLAMYGDRVGRGRMNKDGQTRKSAYTARGLCIITGETIPDVAQSRLARCVIVSFKEDSINLSKLSNLQNNSEMLSFAMKTYIYFMINKQNIEDVKSYIRETYDKLNVQDINNNLHGRTKEIGSILKLGFSIFTMFLLSYKVINSSTQKKLNDDANIVINELLESQAQEIEDQNPSTMFFNALEQLIQTKSIIIKDIEDKDDISQFDSNEFVGFVDAKDDVYYLLPDIIYSKIYSFYARINKKFPIGAKTLWKTLADAKFLEPYHPKSSRPRYQYPKTVNGRKYTVVKIIAPELVFDANNFSLPDKLSRDFVF